MKDQFLLSEKIQNLGRRMRTIGKDKRRCLDELILHPSAFILASHTASQETSRPRQFQLALRRAGEAKDDQTKYSQEYS
jgi:hypothetical protein